MTEVTDEMRQQSDEVTGKATILDIRMRSISADLRAVSPGFPLSVIEEVVTPTMTRYDNSATPAVVYHVNYAISVADSNGRPTVSVDLTMSMIVGLGAGKISDQALMSFGQLGVLDVLHPYVRETVHTLTSRMGLAPLVLDVKRPS